MNGSPFRIAVTGLGAVSAVGIGIPALERALRSGESGIGPVTLFDASDHKTQLAAEVRALRPADHLPGRIRRNASRSDVLGLIAAREAVRDARLGDERDVGVFVGATVGGMLASETVLARMPAEPGLRLPFPALSSHPLSSTADRIARLLGLRGPRATVCTACSSGANAVALARRALVEGRCQVALAGGADSLCRMTFAGFNALGAVDPRPCRPFDRERAGLTLGEAGAMLVLEPLERARARGAVVYAELRGHGACSEAHHITNPQESGAGAARAMRLALADAGLGADRIDYVNAHGTGTRLNDAMESRALAEVLGARLAEVPVSSSKGQLGHTLGAAGAIEAVVTVLSIHAAFAPPTAGLTDPDPDCPLRHVLGGAQPHRIRAALSSSFGFGGNDAALVFAAADDASSEPARAARARGSVVVTGRAALVPESPGPLPDLPKGTLEPGRARRMDPMSRAACAVVGAALSDAALSGDDSVSLILGTAFGAIDESVAFLARLADKGPRLAPPADFPNLVLSAPAAHASIYHALRGMHLSVSALAVSGDQAIALASSEVAAAGVSACAAGALEVGSAMRRRVLARWTTVGSGGPTEPSEGGAMLVLEQESAARARGATIHARVLGWAEAAHPLDGRDRIVERSARAIADALVRAGVEPAEVRAAVAVHDRSTVEAALRTALGRSDVPLEMLSDRLGFHEAMGAEAGRVAVQRAGAQAGPVITLGLAPGLTVCIVYGPP